MKDNENKVSLKDYFGRKNEKKMQQDLTDDFSIIPSWNKEFVCLLGLEDVVQFRLESMDKSAEPSPPRTKGRQRKVETLAGAEPATPRKDPHTCAKCNTDVSCSWTRDVDSSIECHSCFKSRWRKNHRPSVNPPDPRQTPHPDSPLSSDLSSSPGCCSDLSCHYSPYFPSDHYYSSCSTCGTSVADDSPSTSVSPATDSSQRSLPKVEATEQQIQSPTTDPQNKPAMEGLGAKP